MKTMKFNHLLILIFSLLCVKGAFAQQADNTKPNIIMIMADDLGYGDVGFNGNPFIKTPELDKMASSGLQFTRFYSAAPVCSPTRGSCLTGRHPDRYGIYLANVGHLKKEEVTIAEVLKEYGYTTGHFGKWHLGTLTKSELDGRRGGRENEHYSPPWENGFDVCFSAEAAMPTSNPMENQPFPTKYWTGPGEFATQNLAGSSSKVIMDRIIPFIENAVTDNKHFFAVVWFHVPHAPVVAGQPYLDLYSGFDENHQHYYGCVSDMDEQIGRLRNVLMQLKVHENTIVFFTSDNGPAGEGGGVLQYPGKRQQGSSGMFRGRKGSLYEGGIRVPALLEWPAKFGNHQKIGIPLTTSDYYPTILSLLNIQCSYQPRPLDGIDFLPLLTENKAGRPQPIAFKSVAQRAYMDNQYKIYSQDDGQHYELYDLLNDPSETINIAMQKPELIKIMAYNLEEWIKSCRFSEKGEDYLKQKAKR